MAGGSCPLWSKVWESSSHEVPWDWAPRRGHTGACFYVSGFVVEPRALPIKQPPGLKQKLCSSLGFLGFPIAQDQVPAPTSVWAPQPGLCSKPRTEETMARGHLLPLRGLGGRKVFGEGGV